MNYFTIKICNFIDNFHLNNVKVNNMKRKLKYGGYARKLNLVNERKKINYIRNSSSSGQISDAAVLYNRNLV